MTNKADLKMTLKLCTEKKNNNTIYNKKIKKSFLHFFLFLYRHYYPEPLIEYCSSIP